VTSAPSRRADLVLEGGGVKGLALVGAATALDEAGWRFQRIAGSSAGALVGAIIAAMQQAGESMARVDDILRTLDYERMLDRRPVGKALAWWPFLANSWGIVRHLGMYRGHYMTQWVRGVLAEFGVRTFADFAFDDPGSALERGQSFRLVVTASD
jgi:NTE family protein